MQNITTKKLAMLLITTLLTLGSGAALAADNSSAGSGSDNGLANQSNSAESIQKTAPNDVSNDKINTGGTDTSKIGSTDDNANLNASEIHKNTMCKDGRCPDTNSKVETGKGGPTEATKTDGTTN